MLRYHYCGAIGHVHKEDPSRTVYTLSNERCPANLLKSNPHTKSCCLLKLGLPTLAPLQGEFDGGLETEEGLESVLESERHEEEGQAGVSTCQLFPDDPPRGTADKCALNSPETETKHKARAISTVFPFPDLP